MTVAKTPVLDVSGVEKAFGARRVLQGISLAVAPGEIVALLGPSGCGKTTLLRLIAGFMAPNAGEITLSGAAVSVPGLVLTPPERRGLGMVFQDSALFPHLTVRENIAFGVPAPSPDRVARLLDLIRMSNRAGDLPHLLSGGQQQRVALARALAREPALVLMDEPFSSLDAGLRATVRDESVAILREAGVAAILVTHDPQEAMSVADRVALMEAGRIVQVDTPAGLYGAPVSPFAAAFTGPVNLLPGTVSGGAVHTALGEVACPDALPEDGSVAAYVRPEDILLDGTEGAAATVADVRLLGPVTRIDLRVAAETELSLIAHALSGTVAVRPGDAVCVHIRPGAGFCFPA